jgi:hypothetical protein
LRVYHVSGCVLKTCYLNSVNPHNSPVELDTVIFTLQMRKRRSREVRTLAQGCTTRKWLSRDLNLTGLATNLATEPALKTCHAILPHQVTVTHFLTLNVSMSLLNSKNWNKYIYAIMFFFQWFFFFNLMWPQIYFSSLPFWKSKKLNVMFLLVVVGFFFFVFFFCGNWFVRPVWEKKKSIKWLQ